MNYFAESAASSLALNLDVLWWHWALLAAWFLSLILFDLLVVHRRDREPTIKGSILQSTIWMLMGIGLGFVTWHAYGAEASGQYFAGYLIELSLSIDNVFAWSVILGYFAIPKKYHHRVLFWGIIGAIVMRAIFVFAGLAVIDRFEPILLLFGGILLFSGVRMVTANDKDKFNPDRSKFYSLAKRVVPFTEKLDGHKLFTKVNGRRVATLLFMALLAVETTDVVFAVDSVPAIIAVSREPFIIIASNAAAILGMRALYFVFESIKDSFWMLHYALGLLLVFVGLKLFLAPAEVLGRQWFNFHMPTAASLGVIAALIGGAMLGSVIIHKPKLKKKI